MYERRSKFLIATVAGFFSGLLLFLYYYYDRNGKFPGVWSGWDAFIFSSYGIISGILFLITSRILKKWSSWKKSFGIRFLLGFIIQLIISCGLLIVTIYVLELASIPEVKMSDVFWDNM